MHAPVVNYYLQFTEFAYEETEYVRAINHMLRFGHYFVASRDETQSADQSKS